MYSDILPEEAPAQQSPAFTYSHPDQPLFRRAVIRAIERASGRARLQRLYADWASHGKRPGESVFEAALRLLDIRPRLSGAEHLDALPREGGLLLIANHPFGIIDGLSLGRLGMELRGNVHILTNSLLCRLPEVDPHLLPVDFSGTPEARRLTSETRRRAAALLAAGKVVAIFPAGGIATANRPLKGHAVDSPWHPFVGRLATLPGVTTLPLHFPGQNSRLFQIASHSSYALRLALIFFETRRRMGRPVEIRLGEPITAEELAPLDRTAIANTLRRRTMALAGPALPDPDEVFHWPAHIRW
ncbi:glycerol acyltransferase [Tabrizicola sp. TH137]|uniref:1-acyl-sn-glycerol-3-phosphate acyltransferase n=1 Tax=Tabrizicola sp. TH137 TaxID=2067452 RepID=UPI000C7A029B|nr:1-acyl-sn-glycerol-3-phosphate acyltransferase [Tabrizicola sp. TH137]PLL11986.1 glycerol acyltransferase [Tabrizicola sp. TH137]